MKGATSTLILLFFFSNVTFSDAQEASALSLNVSEERNGEIHLIVSSDTPIRSGAMVHILQIGDVVLDKSIYTTEKDRCFLTFSMPAAQYWAIPDQAPVTLIYGSPTREAPPLSFISGQHWRLGALNKKGSHQ